MKYLYKLFISTLLLLTTQVGNSFAQGCESDLFYIDIVHQTPTSLTITCNLNNDYSGAGFDCPETMLYWDFGDGIPQVVPINVASLGVSHIYSVSPTERSYFSREISLVIAEAVMENGECKYKSDICEEEILEVNLDDYFFNATVIPESVNGMKVNEPINFSSIVTVTPYVNDIINYEILIYDLTVGTGFMYGNGSKTDLEGTFTPSEIGTHFGSLKLTLNDGTEHTEDFTFVVNAADEADDPDDTPSPDCPPPGTFDYHVSSSFLPEESKTKVEVRVVCNDEKYSKHKIYLGRFYSTDTGQENVVLIDKKPFDEIKNPIEVGKFFVYISDLKELELDFQLDVFNNDESNICHSAPVQRFKHITIPKPVLDPDYYNQVDIKPDGENSSIYSYISGCKTLVIINPNNLNAEDSWLNIDIDELGWSRISVNPNPNYLPNTREAEIRIHSKKKLAPALYIDKNGNINNYRSIWYTQKSILSDVNFESSDGFPFSYESSDPDVAYYGLFDDKYLVREIPNEIPIDMLLANVNSDGEIVINSYDSEGKFIGTNYFSFKSSTCESYWNYYESMNYDLYIANINRPVRFSDFVFDIPTETLIVAKDYILLSPVHGEFEIKYGTNFTARIGNCIAPKSATTTEHDLYIVTEESEINYSLSPKIISSNHVLLLYPNPTETQFTLEIEGDYTTTQTIEIFNKIGQVVFVKKSDIEHKNTIDIQHWPEGIYFVRVINTKGEVAVKKLVKN